MKNKEIWDYTANAEQLYSLRNVEVLSGRAKGINIVELENANGLSMDILSDMGMDIGKLRYKGKSIAWISKNGYGNKQGDFFKSFSGGMLYTCGLQNVGSACVYEGVEHKIHGNYHNISCENFHSTIGENSFKLYGEMVESEFFGINLVLKRSIEVGIFKNEIIINDVLENRSDKAAEFMLLYHMNFGYPFLDEGTKLYLPKDNVCQARDEQAQIGLGKECEFTKPQANYKEQVFFHKSKEAFAEVHNEKLNIKVKMEWSKDILPNLVQWKSMAKGDYAFGIEPANCFVMGRKFEKENGSLQSIEAYGKRSYFIKISFEDII